MKQWRFEVFSRSGFSDVHGQSVLEDIKELGINLVQAVQSAKVFLIEADFDEDFARRVARELLADPVCEEYYVGRSGPPAGGAWARGPTQNRPWLECPRHRCGADRGNV